MKTGPLGVQCLGIILVGILASTTHTTRTFVTFAVGQPTFAGYSTLADQQMIAAHTDRQDGVNEFIFMIVAIVPLFIIVTLY